MTPKLSASYRLAFALPSLARLALVAGVALGAGACEDKAIGRPCDLQADAGETQATFNQQALECPSLICVKPSKLETSAATDTVPYCTAECSSDSDCEGQTRDRNNPKDKRCKSGFVCGVSSVVGPFCCKKICLCKDFVFIPPGGLQKPPSCDKANATSTCRNL